MCNHQPKAGDLQFALNALLHPRVSYTTSHYRQVIRLCDCHRRTELSFITSLPMVVVASNMTCE